MVHLHRLAQGRRCRRPPRAAGSAAATCSTGSRSTSRSACTAAICIEVCPFDALHWSPEFEYAELDIRDLTHEKDRLREWMWTVPAPPALDEHAEPAKEIGTAAEGRRRAPPHDRDGPTSRDLGASWSSCCSALVAVGLGAAGGDHHATWCTPRCGWSSRSARSPGCFLVLAAEFVAWVQVLIYVGAVVVLLLFALMLTRAPTGRTDDLHRAARAARGASCRRWSACCSRSTVVAGFRDVRIDLGDTVVGSAETTGAHAVHACWVLPFEVLSVLLLAALVGAIVLSRLRADLSGAEVAGDDATA